MKITLLGTGSPIPNPLRAGPATLLQTASATVLCDAGRGVVMRLAGAGVVPPMLNAVVLTHLHSDHVCDLNDIITTHWVMNAEPTPLRLYGPVGTQALVDATLAMLNADIGYRIGHHDDLNEGPWVDVTEVEAGSTFRVGDVDVLVGATDHRPVDPSVGFRFTEGSQSAVLAGDGVPCASLDDLVAGATAYVQTVIRDDIVKLIPNARLQDILDYHSTVAQAAETAERAQVAYLVLTHYVPPPSAADVATWRELAAGFSGTTVIGDDLVSVDLATSEVVGNL